MKAFLTAKQTAMLLGCASPRVTERMKRGYWDIGKVIPPKTKHGNHSYEVSPNKLADLAGVTTEEIFRALKEGRPLRV